MPNQKNSFISLMEQVALLNKNSVEILTRLNDVVSSKNNNVTVNLLNDDGTKTQYELPTVGKLKSDLDLINTNVKRLSGLEGQTYIMDGQTSKKVFTVDLSREPAEVSDIGAITNFSQNQNWFFESLMNPLLSVKIDLTDKIDDNTNKILSRRYVVRFQRNADGTLTTAGQSALNDFSERFLGKTNIKINEFLSWYTNPTNTGVINNQNPEKSLDEDTFELNFKELNFKGTFSVLKTETDNINNKIWYHLNTLQYEGRDGSQRNLKIGDQLILNKKGAGTRYTIREISNENALFKARLERVEGYDPIPIGNNVLEYYSPFIANKSVNISIGYNEYNVVFIKPINTENNIVGSLWSYGSAYYTNNLILDTDQNINLLSYYTQTVKDYGILLKDMVKRIIPASKGVEPNSVGLDQENFKVVQINKHVTDTANSETLRKLHADKNTVKSRLEQTQDAIIEKNKELSTRQFKSIGEKTKAQNELNTLIQKQESDSKRLTSITQQITDARALTSLTEDPKFRVRGFFDFPDSQQNQEVIQFRIQYRYSSTDGNVNPSEGFQTLNQEGEEETGYFSNWNEMLSDVRKRQYDVTSDTWVWLDENIADADAPNINQVDIPIRNGERVEFRVKSISEAGWPDSALESEWSDIITIDFPDEFTNLFRQNEFIFEQSIKDEALIELNNDLDSRGVYRHTQDQFFVNETFYAHKDRQISTSFTDNQGNSIDLFNYLQSLQSRIKTVEEELARAKGVLIVKLYKNNQSFILENNSTKKLSVECEEYGDSVRRRIRREYSNDIYTIRDYYIKLENISQSDPLGLLSDKNYEDTTENSTNVFYEYPDAQTIFVDEENNMYTQQDNQFVWFSDNHAGNQINTGVTNYVSISDNQSRHIDLLSSDYNIGSVSGVTDTYGDYNLISDITWDSGGTSDFLATIHPLVKDPDDIVEKGQEKIKQLDATDSFIIPLNIYFKFSSDDTETWQASRSLRTLDTDHLKEKTLKFYIEKEGDLRPFQFTLQFTLKRQYVVRYFFQQFRSSRQLFG